MKRNYRLLAAQLCQEADSNAEFEKMDLDRLAKASTDLAAYETMDSLVMRAKGRTDRYQAMMNDIALRVLDTP